MLFCVVPNDEFCADSRRYQEFKERIIKFTILLLSSELQAGTGIAELLALEISKQVLSF